VAISQYLTAQGFDVFLDFRSINSGDFEQVIIENIKARAHFLVLLTPSALDNSNDPDDWLRREIELALDTKRNIVPIMLEGFDFDAPETVKFLTGKLENLKRYNCLYIYADYIEAGIDRLCNNFLNMPLDAVMHPVSSNVQKIVEEQKRAIAKESQVELGILTAQGWFERALKANQLEEQIRLYTKSIESDSNFSYAFHNRGYIYFTLKQYEQAIKDFDQSIKLNPKLVKPYIHRGIIYSAQGQYERAIRDFEQVVKLDPVNGSSYYNMACTYALQGLEKKAIKWLRQALSINAEHYCKSTKQDSDFDRIRGEAGFQKLLDEFCDKG
jgi:tetratricopeptide (TPR) repeat protein